MPNSPKIPLRYEAATYDDVPQTIKDAFEKITTSRQGIYIHGGVGSGKTHVAYALFAQCPKVLHANAKFHNIPEMLHDWRLDFPRPWAEKMHPEERLLEYRGLLFLDDLGSEKMTEWVEETLYLILNHRYNEVLPTVITSNLTIEQLAERVGDRIASRVVGMCDVVKLEGPDRRLN
jgi:DNA replication protein DnaC